MNRRGPSGKSPRQQIKTGSFERRLSLTRAGIVAGARLAGRMATSVFSGAERRQQQRADALSDQAQYLVRELADLKGSVVKIGQMMALYGEHFLPVEVTEALHTLEDRTPPLDWRSIEAVLVRELGAQRLAELDVDEEALGAASLGQVHRARRRSDGRELCLKVQYPGVETAIDSDLNAVAALLKLARVVSPGPAFDDWLDEVREMMHREVNYHLELDTTARFREMLADDPRYIVPEVFPEYSTRYVFASSYEAGENVTSESVQQLDQERRNHLARAFLDLFLKELFLWQEFQTDPNFGNYRIRQAADGGEDRLVLLDFGAVCRYPASVIKPVCDMIRAAFDRDLNEVLNGALTLRFMKSHYPEPVLKEFARICMDCLEPLAGEQAPVPDECLDERGRYCWKSSDLPTRIAKRAAVSAFNRYFSVPPKEFLFLNRKLIGVYTFLSVLDARFNGRDLLEPYL